MGRPWYPKYPADYAFDTRGLSLSEHGAYNLLMDRYYAQMEPLPSDDEQLFIICAASTEQDRASVQRVCRLFFRKEGGKLHQKRIDQEISKAKALSETRSSASRSKRSSIASNSTSSATQLQSQRQPHILPPSEAVVSSPSPTKPPSVDALESARASVEEPDPIFGAGLSFLTGKGVKERAARGFLGLLRKEVGDLVTGELLATAEREDVSDPCGWLRAAAQRRKANGSGGATVVPGRGPAPKERHCAVCGRPGSAVSLVFTQAGDRCLEHRDVAQVAA